MTATRDVMARTDVAARPVLALAAAGVAIGLLGIAGALAVGRPLLAPVLVGGLALVPVLLTRPLLAVLALTVEDAANLGAVAAPYGVSGIHTVLLAVAVAATALAVARGIVRIPRLPLVVGCDVGYVAVEAGAALAAGWPPASSLAVTETAKDVVLLALVSVVVIATDGTVTLARALVLTVTALALLSVVQEFAFANATDFGGLSNVPLGADVGSVTARHSGPQLDANFWGRVLVLVLPLALSLAASAGGLPARAGGLAAGAVLAAGVYLTGSRGTLIALLAAVVVWLLLAGPRYRRSLLLSPLLLSLLVVPGVGSRLATLADVGSATSIARPDPSLEGRRTAQAAGVLMVLEHPLTGVGPGRFVSEMPGYQRRYALTESPPLAPHNLYLEHAAEGGLLLLVAWLALTGGAALAAVRARLLLGRSSRSAAARRQAALTDGVLAALAGWSVASLFLHLATFRTLLLVLAICVGLEARARAGRRSEATPATGALAVPTAGRPV